MAGENSTFILRLQLHGAIYCHDLFVLMPHHCVNLKAIRYESTSLNRIAADKSHRVIVALQSVSNLFHFIILSVPMQFYIWLSKNVLKPTSKNGKMVIFIGHYL